MSSSLVIGNNETVKNWASYVDAFLIEEKNSNTFFWYVLTETIVFVFEQLVTASMPIKMIGTQPELCDVFHEESEWRSPSSKCNNIHTAVLFDVIFHPSFFSKHRIHHGCVPVKLTTSVKFDLKLAPKLLIRKLAIFTLYHTSLCFSKLQINNLKNNNIRQSSVDCTATFHTTLQHHTSNSN